MKIQCPAAENCNATEWREKRQAQLGCRPDQHSDRGWVAKERRLIFVAQHLAAAIWLAKETVFWSRSLSSSKDRRSLRPSCWCTAQLHECFISRYDAEGWFIAHESIAEIRKNARRSRSLARLGSSVAQASSQGLVIALGYPTPAAESFPSPVHRLLPAKSGPADTSRRCRLPTKSGDRSARSAAPELMDRSRRAVIGSCSTLSSPVAS